MKISFLKKFIILIVMLPFSCIAKEWNFDVFMDDKLIGEHSFQLNDDGKYGLITSSANFKVTLLSIPVYKYKHLSKETWNKDCLLSIESSTQDGGDDFRVKGDTKDNLFVLVEPHKEAFTKECPMTFSYWNPAMLKQNKLLNVQTGEYIELKIKGLGKKIIRVRNENIDADVYQILGPKIDIQLWYKDNTDWIRLESITPDKHHISYILK